MKPLGFWKKIAIAISKATQVKRAAWLTALLSYGQREKMSLKSFYGHIIDKQAELFFAFQAHHVDQ